MSIPLSVLGEAKDLTPKGISDALSAAGKQSEKVAELERTIEALKTTFVKYAQDIENTINSPADPFAKARKMRELSGGLQLIIRGM